MRNGDYQHSGHMSLTNWFSFKGHWINVTQSQTTLTPPLIFNASCISMSKAGSFQTVSTWILIFCPLHRWLWKAAQPVGQQVSGLLMGALYLGVLPGTSPWVIRCQCISTSRQTSSRATWWSTTPPTWQRANWRPWRPGWHPRRTLG